MDQFDMDLSILSQNKLFYDLSQDQLNRLISDVKEVTLEEGQYLIREGDRGREVYYIEEGEVEVLKKTPSSSQDLVIGTLGKGEIVGEMAFIKEGHRESSVRGLKQARLLNLTLHVDEKDPVYLEIKSRLLDLASHRLKTVDQVMKGAGSGLGNLLVWLIGLIFLYLYATRMLELLKGNVISSSIISVPVLALFAFAMMVLIRSSGFSLKLFGFTTKNGGKAIRETFLYCIPLFALIFLIKYAVISYSSAFNHLSYFHISPGFDAGAPPASPIDFLYILCLYAAFVPVQEFIFRGMIQSALEQFLVGKHSALQAILISNLPFSMIHLHISFSMSITLYLLGLFWGWSFSRQKTLIGCCLSHFLVGIWSFYIVGIQDFLIF